MENKFDANDRNLHDVSNRQKEEKREKLELERELKHRAIENCLFSLNFRLENEKISSHFESIDNEYLEKIRHDRYKILHLHNR